MEKQEVREAIEHAMKESGGSYPSIESTEPAELMAAILLDRLKL